MTQRFEDLPQGTQDAINGAVRRKMADMMARALKPVVQTNTREVIRVYEPGRCEPNYANDKTIDGEAVEVNASPSLSSTHHPQADTPIQVEGAASETASRKRTG